MTLAGADDEALAGGFDHLRGDLTEPIDLQDAIDLGEEPLDEAEVPAGEPDSQGQGGGIVGVVRVADQAEVLPLAGEDEVQLLAAEWPELVDEADPRVELGVARQTLLEARHADEHQPETTPVGAIAQLFERGQLQPVGFIDDQQPGPVGPPARGEARVLGVGQFLDGLAQRAAQHINLAPEALGRGRDRGGIDEGATGCQLGRGRYVGVERMGEEVRRYGSRISQRA